MAVSLQRNVSKTHGLKSLHAIDYLRQNKTRGRGVQGKQTSEMAISTRTLPNVAVSECNTESAGASLPIPRIAEPRPNNPYLANKE